MKQSHLGYIMKFLKPVALKAGYKIMRYYYKDPKISFKEDGSPLTEADKEAENIILPALKKIAPNIPVISEEVYQSHNIKAPEKFFLVDPLDGTKEFLKRDGKGSFTVNIALIHNGYPIIGIVYAPALDRLFFGNVKDGSYEETKEKTIKLSLGKLKTANLVAVASESHRDNETNIWLLNHKIKKNSVYWFFFEILPYCGW